MLGGGVGLYFEIWEGLFRNMGGAELGGWRRAQWLIRFGGLVVSVPDSESSVPGLILGPGGYWECESSPRYTQCSKGGGNWCCSRRKTKNSEIF